MTARKMNALLVISLFGGFSLRADSQQPPHAPVGLAGETAVLRMQFDAPPLKITTAIRCPSEPSGTGEAFSLNDHAVFIDRGADGVQPLEYVYSLPLGQAVTAEYELSTGGNVEDFQYSVLPNVACPSGAGVLRLSFRTGNQTYFSWVNLRVKVPAFDAVGATLRLWVRHTPRGLIPSPRRAVQVELCDQSGETVERWRYYGFPSGDWHRVEVTQGERSGTASSRHHVVRGGVEQNVWTRISEVGITVIGYNTVEGDDFYIGGLEVIPAGIEPTPAAIEPRYVAPRQVKNLAGTWRLRPEADADGEQERWFDPALDPAGFGAEVTLGFWDAKNDPVAWYRKTFSLTPEMRETIRDQNVYLLFFGVDESCWLWLNGQPLGSHSEDRKEGWDKPFAVNVTQHLRAEGENVLAVKVLNRERAGGIWRPVWLVVGE